MRKKIAVLFAVLLAGASMSAYAEFGIGAQGGYSVGGPGLALLLSPAKDLHFAVNWWGIGDKSFTIGVSGDYWVWTPTITKVGSGALNFFVGPGLYIALGVNGDTFAFDAGGRIPFGLDLNFKKIDIFLQAVPAIGFSFVPSFGLNWNGIGGNIGVRFWF
jgi:hypothetical protein